jgi:hypothetical protein
MLHPASLDFQGFRANCGVSTQGAWTIAERYSPAKRQFDLQPVASLDLCMRFQRGWSRLVN